MINKSRAVERRAEAAPSSWQQRRQRGSEGQSFSERRSAKTATSQGTCPTANQRKVVNSANYEMNPRKEMLYSISVLFSLAALPEVSWGVPLSKRTVNSGDSANCTQQATTLYEMLTNYYYVKGNVTFRVEKPNLLRLRFSETAKDNSDFNLSDAFERKPEDRRDCPGVRNFSTVVSKKSLCSWKYQCNFDPKRVPASIFTAEMQSGNTAHTVGQDGQYQCKPIYMPLNVLKLKCSQNGKGPEWELVREKVTVGYTAVAIA